MPLYEYHCDECKITVELRREIDHRDCVPACLLCHKPTHRALSAPEFSIKGGGTRNHSKIKMWSLKDRMAAKYGDNP